MFTGRDTDLMILENLEDKDILNLFLVSKSSNKLCKDENFWRIRCIKKWGLCEFKNYRKYYFSILKCLKGTNDFDIGLSNAIEYKDIVMVKFMIDKGAKNFDTCLKKCIEKGNFDIFKLILEKNNIEKIDTILALTYARKHGFHEIADYMVEKGVEEFYEAYDTYIY
jgi:hypothetical protein